MQTTIKETNKSEHLKTWHELMTSGNGLDSYSNFAGNTDHAHDYLVMTQTRDSDCLERSNFKCAYDELRGVSKDDVYIVRHGHWACGWIEHIMVKPNTKCQDVAEEIMCALADYPVLNDNDLCELEMEDADIIWRDCYDVKDRINYIRENKSQFEFNSFSEVRAVVNGDYFIGYASELIG